MRVEQDEFGHVSSLRRGADNGVNAAYSELVGIIQEKKDILLQRRQDCMVHVIEDEFIDALQCTGT